MRLNEQQARQRFTGSRVARLATIRRGEPRLVPIVFAVQEDTIYTAIDNKPKSTTHLRRLDDIAASPSVSVLADHYEDDWTQLWWVRADGVARVISAGDAAIELLAQKYEQYAAQRPPGPVIAIDVQTWTGWSAGP